MKTSTIKNWSRRFIYVVLALVCLVLALGIAVQTPPGKTLIAQSASYLVTRYTRYTLHIDGISGTLPQRIRIDALAVADAGGALATIHNLDISLDLIALLRGRLHVRALHLAHVELWKRPTPKERWRIPKVPTLPAWPTVDTLLLEKITLHEPVLGTPATLTAAGKLQPIADSLFPSVTLEVNSLDANNSHGTLNYAIKEGMPLLSLAVEDDTLLPALLKVTPPVKIVMEGKGKRTNWKGSFHADAGEGTLATGTFRLEEGETTTLKSVVQCNIGMVPVLEQYTALVGDTITIRTDGALDKQGVVYIAPLSLASETTSATVTGNVDLEQDRLALTLTATYDNLARVLPSLPQDNAFPLQVATTLRGPFVAPEVDLRAMLTDSEILTGHLQLEQDTVFALQGNLHITPPAILQEITGLHPENTGDITFDIAYAEDTGIVQLTQLTMAGMGVDASLEGSMKPETPSLDLRLAVAAETLMPLSVLLPVSLKGGITGSLTVKATADHLVADVASDLHGLQIDQLQLAEGHIEAGAQWDHWFSTAPENIVAHVKAAAARVQYPAFNPVDMTLATNVTGAGLQELKINSFSISDGNIAVAGNGQVDMDSLTGTMNLDTDIADLSLLPVEKKGLPKGTLQVQTQLQGGISPLSLEVDVTGTVKDIGNIPSPLVALLGETVSFNAKTMFTDHDVEIREAQFQGAGLNISGKTVYQWKSKTLTSEVEASLPTLGDVGLAIDEAVAGTVEINASAEGVLPKLTVNAQVKGHDLTYGTIPPVEAFIEIAATDVPANMAATIAGHVDNGEATLSLRTQAALEADAVVITPFVATCEGNEISGQASWPLADGLPRTQLEGTLDNINALASLAGLEMSGTAKASLTIEQEDAAFTTEVHALRYGSVSLERINATANAAKVFSTPSGTLSVEAHNMESGSALINRFAIQGEGDQNNFTLTSSAAGHFTAATEAPQPLSCKTTARVLFAERRIVLDQMEGTLGAFPFALADAAAVILSKTAITLKPTQLHIGEGTIYAEAQNNGDKIQGKLRLEKMPLALSTLFITPSITGALDAALTAGGTLANPTVEAAIEVSEARLDMATTEALAPLEATLNARMANGNLHASFAAEMKEALTVKAQGDIPLLVQLRPATFELPANAPLSGSLEYTLLPAPVLLALGILDHQLDSTLTGNFKAAGSSGMLQLSGDTWIKDGRYTNTVAGTHLENLNLRVVAEGSSLRLQQGTANAGKEGAVNATGELQLLASQQFPFSLNINFDNAEFARLSYLNGHVDGALDIQGNISGASVNGRLEIGPVYASMPDQLPISEPTVLDVVEIRDDQVVEEELSAPGKNLPEVNLDIHCNIPGRVYVRAPVLDSEWGGNLHIGGDMTNPQIEGRIAVLRGHLDFLGRRFQLRDSAFSFPGGAPTDLWLDMRAVAQTQSLSSQLRLTGTLSEVKLALTSEPPLPQDEVLAQVLFGRDLSRISPVQAIQLARVAAMFNKGLAGMQFFSGTVGLPGIDRIDIRTGEKADETVVGMGKYLTDSVYVEVEQGTATDSGKVSVEVEVTPNISVKGDVDAKERSGVGLFWNKDY